MLKVLDNEVATEEQAEGPTLDELAREGARRMLMKALAVEVAQYVDEHADDRDEQGRRLVVRNGQAQARKVTCGAGTLEVRAPRVNDKRVEAGGQRQRFTSRILPPYMRRSPKVAEVLPILYLRGLSPGDFREALPVLLGEDAAGESVGVSRSPSSLMPPARGDESHRHEVMDVTDPAYPALLGRLVQETGPFDACIYCVGVGSELELSDLSHEARVFEVNLTAMVRTLEILLPPWLERRAGHFIGLSSMADTLLNPGAPSYSASKAGFSNYLLGMALRLRPHGIAVTNVRFGFVDTKMAKAVRKPLIMTVDRAAGHPLDCLETRPIQLSRPSVAAAGVLCARWLQTVRIWWS